jgi:hypothetical protein
MLISMTWKGAFYLFTSARSESLKIKAVIIQARPTHFDHLMRWKEPQIRQNGCLEYDRIES